MVQAKKFSYINHFDGEPKATDFQLESEELPDLKNGDVLVEAVYWSVDPYVRVRMPQFPLNSTMIGEQIAVVIDSKDDNFSVGSFVWGFFGWRDLTIFNIKSSKNTDADNIAPYIVDNIEGIPIETRLSALGMTGVSAFFGFFEACQPNEGDTVVISGGAGAVGSLVGQIAKLKNCRVIGIAGRQDKCQWIQNELGFDVAINYKEENIDRALKTAAPNGVDIYFDNVGGDISKTILSHLNQLARICICGAISTYNTKLTPPITTTDESIIQAKQLKIKNFMVSDWFNRWNESVDQLTEWIKCGKLKYRHTITTGFENMPAAFIGMLRGENIGKALVRK